MKLLRRGRATCAASAADVQGTVAEVAAGAEDEVGGCGRLPALIGMGEEKPSAGDVTPNTGCGWPCPSIIRAATDWFLDFLRMR